VAKTHTAAQYEFIGRENRQTGIAMKDYQASIEKLRKDAAEAALDDRFPETCIMELMG
jgi:hypothetical protein